MDHHFTNTDVAQCIAREKEEKLSAFLSYLLPEAIVSDIMHIQISFWKGLNCDAFWIKRTTDENLPLQKNKTVKNGVRARDLKPVCLGFTS